MKAVDSAILLDILSPFITSFTLIGVSVLGKEQLLLSFMSVPCCYKNNFYKRNILLKHGTLWMTQENEEPYREITSSKWALFHKLIVTQVVQKLSYSL
jgi:hypothetical protein